MPSLWLIVLIVLLLLARLSSLRRFWLMPQKQGTNWFFTTEVESGFYQGEGARLLGRYRRWLLAPMIVDAIAVTTLIFNGKAFYILHEQVVANVLTAVYNNWLVINFAYRAKTLTVPADGSRPTTAQLVMSPRRLRDHSDWRIELLVLIATLSSAALLLAVRQTIFLSFAWLLYLQAGLVLLKVVFVRWRMKLPVRRTEDYRRWRAAWLQYHLRVFDAARVLIALAMVYLSIHNAYEWTWAPGIARGITLTFWGLTILLFLVYCSREARRLTAVQRDVQPITLVREFPPSPVAEGRFFAGGLFYFNPDNPVVVARSPSGLAINLANRSTYLWLAYLSGLVLLAAWQISR